MKKIKIIVSGMTCNHCEKRIAASLKEIDGVLNATSSFKTKIVDIEYDEKKTSLTEFKNKLKSIGYAFKSVVDENKKEKTSLKDVVPIFITIIILYLIISSITGFNFSNFLPKINNNVSLIMLFLIGLLTSIHCVGMCGSINLAVSVGINNKVSISRPLLYNAGRIISYTIIGAIVGALGSVFSFNSNLQGLLILIASIFMFMMGLAMLGWLPKSLYRILPKLPSCFKANNKTPFIAGLLNGLMPCGPLQAMQLYALSTGSIWLGALSMFIFAIGTVPLVFGVGILFNKLKGKNHIIIQRISSVLVVLLSLIMLSRSLTLLGININESLTNIFAQNQYKDYAISEIKDGHQYVEIKLNARGYTKILVQKGIPVIFNIKVNHIEYYGCTSTVQIPGLNIIKSLQNGDNLIKFTPTKTGDINYACSMGMITSNIKVVDNLKSIKDTIKK